jgi:tubulin polyglutamylase TTLL4
LYGFDILIDEDLKPWLLEVNVLPSLSSSSPFDKIVKTLLICDVLTLVGVRGYDKKKVHGGGPG